jgi:hypothetical protein
MITILGFAVAVAEIAVEEQRHSQPTAPSAIANGNADMERVRFIAGAEVTRLGFIGSGGD